MTKKRQHTESNGTKVPPSNPPNNKRLATAVTSSFTTEPRPTTLRDHTSLRYISSRVSLIVERRKNTTYNEVANELVGEAAAFLDKETSMTGNERRNHEKNIRRRVYDALNVLIATDIITKTKEHGTKEKVIQWKGFPTGGRNELAVLESERDEVMKEVERKKRCLKELIVQNVCFFNLNERNAIEEEKSSKVETLKNGKKDDDEKIPLPFIVVNASDKAVIQCEMNREKTDVMFNFNMPFEINDDNEILKRLGLNKTSREDLKKILPESILSYCEEQHLIEDLLPNTNNNTDPSKSLIPQQSEQSTRQPPQQQSFPPTNNFPPQSQGLVYHHNHYQQPPHPNIPQNYHHPPPSGYHDHHHHPMMSNASHHNLMHHPHHPPGSPPGPPMLPMQSQNYKAGQLPSKQYHS